MKLILDEASDLLRPGMTASVLLQGVRVPGALMLPEAALLDRDRQRVVFVFDGGRARQVVPQLAAGFSNRLQVISGLEAGDEVIVAGHRALLDGTAVVPVREP